MEIDDDDDSNVNLNVLEQTYLQKLLITMKEKLFGVFFVLLSGSRTSIVTLIFCSMIQFLQLLYFSFHEDLVTLWGMPVISQKISGFLQYFTFLRYIEGTSW